MAEGKEVGGTGKDWLQERKDTDIALFSWLKYC